MCIISVRHNCRIFMKSPNKGGGGRGEEGRGGGEGWVGEGVGGNVRESNRMSFLHYQLVVKKQFYNITYHMYLVSLVSKKIIREVLLRDYV